LTWFLTCFVRFIQILISRLHAIIENMNVHDTEVQMLVFSQSYYNYVNLSLTALDTRLFSNARSELVHYIYLSSTLCSKT